LASLEGKNVFWEGHKMGVAKVKEWAIENRLNVYLEGHQLIDLIFRDVKGSYWAIEVKTLNAQPNGKERRFLQMMKDVGANVFIARYDLDTDRLNMIPFS
jgi:hypothetical protein